MHGFGIDVVAAGQQARNAAYDSMRKRYETQAATRAAEAVGAGRMASLRDQSNGYEDYAGLDLSGNYGAMPGVAQVAAQQKQAMVQPQQMAQPTPQAAPQPTMQEANAGLARSPVSIGTLQRTGSVGDIVPTDLGTTYAAAITPNANIGDIQYTGRQQYYDLPNDAVKAYNSNVGYIGTYMKSDLANRINTYAKQLGMDANILHSIAMQETAGGRNINNSVQGASGALQIMPNTYRDVLTRLPQLTKNKKVLSMVKSLNPDWEKATPEEKLKGGILYTKMLELLGQKQGMTNKANIFASYFGGEKHLGAKELPWVKDGGGRYIPDYVAMATGYYNTMSPNAQLEMPAVAANMPGNRETSQVQLGTAQQGEPTAQAGIDVSGNYQAPETPNVQFTELAKNAPQVPQAVNKQLQGMLEQSRMLGHYANAMKQTGALDQYLQLAQQRTALDAQIYANIAELGAAELENFGAPQRLMSLIKGFTGMNSQVQLRSDGKLDLYQNGRKVSGKDGITMSHLSTMVKNMVSAQARQAHMAAASEAQKYQAELAKTALQGQYDMAKAGLSGQYGIAAARARGEAQSGGAGLKSLGQLTEPIAVADRNGQIQVIQPGQTYDVDGKMVQGAPTAQPIAGLYRGQVGNR